MTVFGKQYDVRNDDDRETLFNDIWDEVKGCMEDDNSAR